LIEQAIFSKLEDYRYQNRKKYFECLYEKLIKIIAECIEFFEDIKIDTIPNINSFDKKTN